jgi:hypothetical protein
MKEQTCIVCTGKLGDILNILPICQHLNTAGQRVSLMVAKEYASILDGVSYVDPVVIHDSWTQLGKAVDLAKTQFTALETSAQVFLIPPHLNNPFSRGLPNCHAEDVKVPVAGPAYDRKGFPIIAANHLSLPRGYVVSKFGSCFLSLNNLLLFLRAQQVEGLQ